MTGRNDEQRRAGQVSPEDRDRLKRDLEDLGERIGDARAHHNPRVDPTRGRSIGYALRLAIDFIAAVVVGGAIGWFIDDWAGTRPAFLLLFGALGLAAGARNVMRTYRLMVAEATAAGTPPGSGRTARADEGD